MVVKTSSLSRYSTILHIEKCGTKERKIMTTVERMGKRSRKSLVCHGILREV